MTNERTHTWMHRREGGNSGLDVINQFGFQMHGSFQALEAGIWIVFEQYTRKKESLLGIILSE